MNPRSTSVDHLSSVNRLLKTSVYLSNHNGLTCTVCEVFVADFKIMSSKQKYLPIVHKERTQEYLQKLMCNELHV